MRTNGVGTLRIFIKGISLEGAKLPHDGGTTVHVGSVITLFLSVIAV